MTVYELRYIMSVSTVKRSAGFSRWTNQSLPPNMELLLRETVALVLGKTLYRDGIEAL